MFSLSKIVEVRMFRLSLRFLFLIFSVALVGCATTPLNEAKKDSVNNVATAVLFDDTLPVAYVGTTIFNNADSKVNISSWNLNSIVTREIETGLKSIGKTYKPVSFDKQKIKTAIESGDTALNRFVGDPNKELNEYLFSSAVSQGAKYLFVFQPIKHDNFPHYPKGLGLFCRSAFGTKGDWEAYSLFHVALWDLTTKEKVYQTAFSPADTALKSGKPCDELKNTSPEKFATLFKGQFQEIAKKSADMTLKKSGLLR